MTVGNALVQSPQLDGLLPIFMAAWVGLAIVSALFFHLSKNAPLKRRWWGPFTIFSGVLFGAFVWSTMPGIPWFFFLGIAIITALNVFAVRFCDACGKTLHSPNPFSPLKFCSKCGSPLR